MNERPKEKLTNVVKVQDKDVEDQVTGMVIDLLKQKGFTFANFESVVARVKSHYQNNAII
ncbi:hypothetical protein EQH89_02360 [Lacticaseibacillus paracasei]|uniref:hypothetical protein n=1 Tax=Lacticaseibacillus paracasei TaxID=1597 RepID=UPI000FF1495E|nr:hypothetical protein [Lacticaseibacillus paracasei]MCG4284885.1 hypothetical protein [Lacticaseibacillus paracasei]RWZ62056.1 hypothetical protein EQH89_02360 [Lacticaseibacillus paracasei]